MHTRKQANNTSALSWSCGLLFLNSIHVHYSWKVKFVHNQPDNSLRLWEIYRGRPKLGIPGKNVTTPQENYESWAGVLVIVFTPGLCNQAPWLWPYWHITLFWFTSIWQQRTVRRIYIDMVTFLINQRKF